MTLVNDTTRVTNKTVVWSVKLVSGSVDAPLSHLAMGVGWDAFLAAIKHMRISANEDQGDKLLCTWTGSGAMVYQWTWDAMHDVPALLPSPAGFVLDTSTEV